MYTIEEYLKAAEIGEVSMIDATHVVSLLDEARDEINKQNTMISTRFEESLLNLINHYIEQGLSNSDLVSKMKRATLNCKFS
jgi:hypothetical protein